MNCRAYIYGKPGEVGLYLCELDSQCWVELNKLSIENHNVNLKEPYTERQLSLLQDVIVKHAVTRELVNDEGKNLCYVLDKWSRHHSTQLRMGEYTGEIA